MKNFKDTDFFAPTKLIKIHHCIGVREPCLKIRCHLKRQRIKITGVFSIINFAFRKFHVASNLRQLPTFRSGQQQQLGHTVGHDLELLLTRMNNKCSY